jgi:pimeloyl-ACP methyl ester carboxylesterase
MWIGVVLFAGAFMALHAAAGMFSKHDDPARLGASVRISVSNGFTLRWVEKPGVTNGLFDLVFVHGSPGGAGVWASQFNSPLSNANLFAYDRPGFGGSKPARRQPHLQEQADALMTLLASATTNRVLLIGHSYGSPIALLAALEHPAQIGGVLLIGGDVDPSQEKPWLVQYLFGWEVTSWILPQALRQCNREMLTVRADLLEMQKLLPNLSVPVVMLHGDKDPLVPVQNVAWLEQQLAAAGRSNLFAKIILPGVNHFIPWEHPGEVERGVHLLEVMARNQSTPTATSH